MNLQCNTIIGFLLLIFLTQKAGAGNAVISIDLGYEFIKAAFVKPGVKMEIVLNKEFQRKTLFAVGFSNGERLFSGDALKLITKSPKQVFTCFRDLIGKSFDSDAVKKYKDEHPHIKMLADEKRGTVIFDSPEGQFSVEELLAMILENIKKQATIAAGQPVDSGIITVPAFYTDAQRKGIAKAAEIAGINLIGFLNDGSSAGLNYGVFRQKEINETSKTLLIYDVGSGSTVATLLEYKLINVEKSKEPVLQMTVLGVGFNQYLGGNEITLRLQKFLIEEFNKKTKTQKSILEDDRAMAKILKEAERVKTVLSANNDTIAQIENLFENQDFKHKVSRVDLMKILEDLNAGFLKPLYDVFKMSEFTIDKVDQVVLVGGGTRVPSIQQLLQDYFNGRDLGRFLNTDESIAFGAVYQAAYLTKGYRLKSFVIIELQTPLQEDKVDIPDLTEEDVKNIKDRLSEFVIKERERAERDQISNSLEATTYNLKHMIDEGSIKNFVIEEEYEVLKTYLVDLLYWIEEEMGAKTTIEEMTTKKKQLDDLYKPIKHRIEQKKARGPKVELLNKKLQDSLNLDKYKKLAPDVKEINTTSYENKIKEIAEWFKTKSIEQSNLADNQDPAFTVSDLNEKLEQINREEKYLLGQIYTAKMKLEKEKFEKERQEKIKAEKEKASEKGEEKDLPTSKEIPKEGEDLKEGGETENKKEEESAKTKENQPEELPTTETPEEIEKTEL